MLSSLKNPHVLKDPSALGDRIDWQHSRADLFERVAKLDDVVRIQFGGMDRYFVNHPVLIGEICRNQNDHFEVTRDDQVMKRVLGESVFTLRDEQWWERRKQLAPLYNRAGLKRMTTQIEAALREFQIQRLDGLAAGGITVDLEAECISLVHAVFSKIMFGGPFDHRLENLQHPIETALTYRETLRWRKPSDCNQPDAADVEFDRICASFEATLSELIHENRDRKSGGEWTLLSDLLALSKTELSIDALQDEVKTFFHSSTLSTASALTWALFLILTHPLILSDLKTQIRQSIPSGRRPVAEDMSSVPLARYVILETLRLFPPSWVTSRHVRQDTHLGDYSLQGGLDLVFSPYVIQRDNRFWSRPERFDPYRFSTDDEGAALLNGYSFIPFGGGPRQCIGKGLAMIELQLILTTLIQQFEIDLLSDHTVEILPLTVLKPKTKIMVTFIGRS